MGGCGGEGVAFPVSSISDLLKLPHTPVESVPVMALRSWPGLDPSHTADLRKPSAALGLNDSNTAATEGTKPQSGWWQLPQSPHINSLIYTVFTLPHGLNENSLLILIKINVPERKHRLIYQNIGSDPSDSPSCWCLTCVQLIILGFELPVQLQLAGPPRSQGMLGKQQRSVFFVLIGWLVAFVFIPTNEPITRLTDTRGVTSVMRSSWWRSLKSVCLSSRWRQRRRSGSFRTEEDAVNYFYCHLSFIFAFYIIVEPLVHSED